MTTTIGRAAGRSRLALVDTPYGGIELASGGTGDPVLVLHRDSGDGAWHEFHDALAPDATVYSPSLPGFGGSHRPSWAREPRDLAIITLGLLRQLGEAPVTVVGCGFGVWVAAEMATIA